MYIYPNLYLFKCQSIPYYSGKRFIKSMFREENFYVYSRSISA
ncbi:hypothetical protein BAXH7_00525 [Bacillus amyloliquefaciens XH7]|nr:hypothetical protein BAXH7_00525 [Bacillus amyloliquefaciens XH7]